MSESKDFMNLVVDAVEAISKNAPLPGVGTENVTNRDTIPEMRRCAACDEDRPIEKFNDESLTPNVCFRCKTRSVAVGGHLEGGKDFFHNTTVREGQRRTVAEAAANGIEAIPVKQSNYYGF